MSTPFGPHEMELSPMLRVWTASFDREKGRISILSTHQLSRLRELIPIGRVGQYGCSPR